MSLFRVLQEVPVEDARPVIFYRGVRLSRGEFFIRIRQAASALRQRGLQPGQRVGLALSNPAIFLITCLGVVHAGGVATAVQWPWLTQTEASPLDNLHLTWLVHDRRSIGEWPYGGTYTPLVVADLFFSNSSWSPSVLEDGAVLEDGDQWSEQAPCLLVQSSGTTGQPKTAVISQSAVKAAVRMGEQFLPDDRVMIFTDMAMYWTMLTALRVIRGGGKAVLQPSHLPPAELLKLMQEMHANVLVLSADAASKVASFLNDFGDTAGPIRLSRVMVSGGRIAPFAVRTLHEHWGADVIILYGSTELGPMAAWRLSEASVESENHLLSPFPGVEVQVVDAMNQVVAFGEMGYLRLNSPALYSGYLDQTGQISARGSDWFYPGDTACLTMEAKIQLLGRTDHVLNLGGRKIDPESIEWTIRRHPQVADAAVVMAAMGPTQVGVLVGLLVLKPHGDESVVREFCKNALSDFEKPEYWAVVSGLPRNAAGKLQRQKLASMVRLEQV